LGANSIIQVLDELIHDGLGAATFIAPSPPRHTVSDAGIGVHALSNGLVRKPTAEDARRFGLPL